MAKWVDLDNPKIIKEGRDKFGNVLYGIPPETQTADVRPVRRGRWEIRAYGIDGEDVYCSVCKCGSNMPYWPFCPMCGADMRWGNTDGDTKD